MPDVRVRHDTEILDFLLKTGFYVSSECRAERYFVHPFEGKFDTAREAVSNAMNEFEKRAKRDWRLGWRSTAEMDE